MTQSNNKQRAQALADRLTQGANALFMVAKNLTDEEWKKPVDGDGRPIGVVVHHVANVYPIEIELANVLTLGKPITDVTMTAVNQMNAEHASEFENVGKNDTLALLAQNSKMAADIIRSLSDAELDNSAPVSLYANAPLTAQFFIEDHALRHSYHHLSTIQKTLNKVRA